jgi:hypothetical protein
MRVHCQEVTHDYRLAFEAVIRCCKDYDWDATVANMVYVWTATRAGPALLRIPGIEVPPDNGFSNGEPPEDNALLREDRIRRADRRPTGFPL